MRFSTALVAAFATLAIAAPTGDAIVKRAAVLSQKTYDQISISGGKAGNAQAEALAVFSALNLNDKANVDKADIAFLGSVNNIGNKAEVGAFNPAIAAATGTAKDSLQVGKIKNKVLKLTATVLQLQIQAAQGKDTAERLATETKKLNNNIALDKAKAGTASTKLNFDATTS